MAYRYLGNKSRIVDSNNRIRSAARLPAGAGGIADPMCGTGAVSFALALAGYSVHASDELKFPTLHARARLLVERVPLFRNLGGYPSAVHELNSQKVCRGLFYREYSSAGRPTNGCKPRCYFTPENAEMMPLGIELVTGIRSGRLRMQNTRCFCMT